MSSLHTLKTHLSISLGGISEHEVEAHVSYWFTRGWPASSQDPGCGPSVEIDNIQIVNSGQFHRLPTWLSDVFCDDEDLLDECMADKAAGDEYARDQVADAAREDRI